MLRSTLFPEIFEWYSVRRPVLLGNAVNVAQGA